MFAVLYAVCQLLYRTQAFNNGIICELYHPVGKHSFLMSSTAVVFTSLSCDRFFDYAVEEGNVKRLSLIIRNPSKHTIPRRSTKNPRPSLYPLNSGVIASNAVALEVWDGKQSHLSVYALGSPMDLRGKLSLASSRQKIGSLERTATRLSLKKDFVNSHLAIFPL